MWCKNYYCYDSCCRLPCYKRLTREADDVESEFQLKVKQTKLDFDVNMKDDSEDYGFFEETQADEEKEDAEKQKQVIVHDVGTDIATLYTAEKVKIGIPRKYGELGDDGSGRIVRRRTTIIKTEEDSIPELDESEMSS